MKKICTFLLTLVYLQVNVAWAGVPAANPFSIFNFQFSPLKKKDVLVFHANQQAWDWMRNQPPPPTKTSLEKLDPKQPEPLKAGRHENNKSDHKADMLRNEAKPSVDMLLKNAQGKSNLETADLIAGHLISALPSNLMIRADSVGSQLKELVQQVGANGPTVSQLGQLEQMKGTFKAAGIKVEFVGNKLQVQKVETPPVAQVESILPNQNVILANPNPNRETLVRAGAGNSNFNSSIREAGYNGNIADINRGSIQLENGTKMVRTTEGVRFVGKASFTTNDGIKVTIEGTAAGRVTIHKQATQNATFVEVGRGNKPVAQTIFKAGDSETRVNGTLTHFEAKNGAITREVLAQPGRGANNGADVKPGALKGSIGEYVVRQGSVVSTFKMIANKVALVDMKDNLSGQLLAKLSGDGQMHATELGTQRGLEKTFTVLDGPHFDDNTGQAQLNIVFAAAGQTRELVIPKNGKGGAGDGAGPQQINPEHSYKNVDAKLMGSGAEGTRFQITGLQGAQMAATMTLNGETRLSQRVVGENITYRDQAGKLAGHTLDALNVQTIDDAGNVLSTSHPTVIFSEQEQFAKIGAVNTMPVEVPRNAQISGSIQIKEGQIVSADMKAQMNNGSVAQFTVKDGQRQLSLSTVNAASNTTFDFGNNKISVPQGRELTTLGGNFQPEKGSFQALDGVRVQMGTNSFTYKFDQANQKLSVADVNVQSVRFSDVNMNLNSTVDSVKLVGSQVYFEVKNGGAELTNQPIRDSAGNQQNVDGAVKYVSFGLDGRMTASMEVAVKAPIVLPAPGQGGGSSSLVTPGAATHNVVFDEGTQTINPLQNAGPATVAISVVDSGTGVLDVQFNVFALGSTNVSAGKSGMDFAGTHYSEGMSIDINNDATLNVRTGGQAAVMTTPDGATYSFDTKTQAQLNANSFTVQEGRVVHTEPSELKNLPEGLHAEVKPRQTEITSAGSKILVEGDVHWTTDKAVEIKLPNNAGTMILDEGLDMGTHSTVLVASIASSDIVFNNNKGITFIGSSTTDAIDGLKITVETPRETRLDSSGLHVVKEGRVHFEVANPNGFKNIDKETDAGITAKAGSKFTAHTIMMDGLEVQQGEVVIQGVKAGTITTLAEGVTSEVTQQSVVTMIAGQETKVKEELTLIRGVTGASLPLETGSTLVFDRAAAIVQDGNGFRFHESSAINSKFSIVSGQRVGEAKAYVRNVVSQEKISGTQFRATATVETTDDAGRLRQRVVGQDTRTFDKPTEATSAQRTTQVMDEDGKIRSVSVVRANGDTETRELTITGKNGETILKANQTIKDGKVVDGSATLTDANGEQTTDETKTGFGQLIIDAAKTVEATVQIGGLKYQLSAASALNGQILDGTLTLSESKSSLTSMESSEKLVTLVTAGGQANTGTIENVRTENGATVFDFIFSAPPESRDGFARTEQAGRVFSTGMRFVDGAVSHQLGEILANDNSRIGFTQGSDGLKFNSQEEMAFDLFEGHVSQTIDIQGHVMIQTHFSGDLVGKNIVALGITNQGVDRGIVSYAPAGTTIVEAGGRKIAVTVDGKQVGLARLNEKGKLSGEFLVTSDLAHADAASDYVLEAGSVIGKNEKIKSGSVRVDEAEAGIGIGKNNHVDALTGGGGTASAEKHETVRFKEDTDKNMTMVQGRAYIWTEKSGTTTMGFKPGTVFVNQNKEYLPFVASNRPGQMIANKDAYKQTSVLVANDDGQMVLKKAVHSDGKDGEDIQKDLSQRGEFWEAEVGDNHSLLVLDAENNVIGTYDVANPLRIKELRATSGDRTIEVKTNRVTLQNGTFIQNGQIKLVDGKHSSETKIFGPDGNVSVITTTYFADMTPVKQTTTKEGKTEGIGIYERIKLANGTWKLGWTDSNKQDNFDPDVTLLLGLLTVKESDLEAVTGIGVAVGAVALSPFSGGTSLIALGAAGAFGYLGASASIHAFKQGNDWMGGFYMVTAFLPLGLNAINYVKSVQAGMYARSVIFMRNTNLFKNTAMAWSTLGTANELFTTGAQLIGRYLELSLYSDAAHAGLGAFSSIRETGWSQKTRGALGETIWKTMLAGVGRFAQAVTYLTRGTGKIATNIRWATGFGDEAAKGWKRAAQLTHQTAVVSLVGGVGLASWNGLVGSGFTLSNLGTGGAVAAVAFLAHKVLAVIPNTVANWVKADAKAEVSAIGMYFREGTIGASRMVQDMGAGVITSVSYNTLKNISEGKNWRNWGDGTGYALNRGLFFGFFGGGALRAMSNWGNAFGAMNNELKRTYAFGFAELRGIDAFNWERVVGGFTMGVWEVAFNSMEFKGPLSLFNPFAWANGVSKAFGGSEAEVGAAGELTTLGMVFKDFEDNVLRGSTFEFLLPAFEKFSSTFVNISALHPFFSLGRVGKNPLVDVAGVATGGMMNVGRAMMEKITLSSRILGGTIFVVGYALQKTTIMPLTIKTFEIFESGAEDLAVGAGIIPANDSTELDSANRKGIHLIGFGNAPIHASAQSNAGQYIAQDLRGAKSWSAERRKQAETRAREINSQPGDSFGFDVNGKRYVVDSAETTGLKQQAGVIIGRNKGVSEKVALDIENKEGLAVVKADNTATFVDPGKGPRKQMTAEQAADIIFEQQAGIAPAKERSAKQIEWARERLGMNEGDVLVRITKEMRSSGYQTYVKAHGTDEKSLVRLKNDAVDEFLAPGIGDAAVVRLDGHKGLINWLGAKELGLSTTALKDLRLKSTMEGKLSDLSPEAQGKLGQQIKNAAALVGDAPVTFVLGGGPVGVILKGIKVAEAAGAIKIRGPNGKALDWSKAFAPEAQVDIHVDLRKADGVSKIAIRDSSSKSGPSIVTDVANKRTFFRDISVSAARSLFGGTSVDEKLLQVYFNRGPADARIESITVKSDTGEIVNAQLKGDDYSFATLKADVNEKSKAVGEQKMSVNFTDDHSIANDLKKNYDQVSADVTNPGDPTLQHDFVLAHMADAISAKNPTEAGKEKVLRELDSAYEIMGGRDDREGQRLVLDLKATLKGERPLHREADWVEAKNDFHKVRSELLADGLSRKEMLANRRYQAAQERLVQASGYDGRVKTLRADVERLKESVNKDHSVNGEARSMLATLDRIVTRFERAMKRGDLPTLEALAELEGFGGQMELVLGAGKLDQRRIEEMHAEIDALKKSADPKDSDAAGHLESIANNSKRLITENLTEPDRKIILTAIEKSLNDLRAVYGLEKETGANLNVIDGLYGANGQTKIGTDTAINKIFKTDTLNVAQRTAFILAVGERYFGKDGSLKTQQANLFLQFRLGRIAGLQAGAGKSLVFIMGLADHVLRQKAEGKAASEMTGELLVYAEHEVEKYISDKEYQRIFEAFGMVAVDGRNLAGEDKKTRERAIEAFTPGGTLVKIIVSDLHSRGFLERLLRAFPDSPLAVLVRLVNVLALDEVDASLLSRLSFISSDGDLVAKTKQYSRVEPVTSAVIELLNEGRSTEVNLKDRRTFAYDEASGAAGYRDFKGSDVPDVKGPGKWYVNNDGDIKASDGFMGAIEAKVGKKVTTHEIQQVIRALDAVGNSDAFEFARGAKNDERSDRPTHKSKGNLQHGQIDSSVTFNIATVIFERAARKAKGEQQSRIDAALPLNDIKLSDAGSMATFVQVLQRNIHRFGATGTPEAIKGLAERVIGLKVVDVEPSTYNVYRKRIVNFVETVYAGSRTDDKTIHFLDRNKSGQTTAELAGKTIRYSDGENAGILIGSAKENELRESLYGYIENLEGGSELVAELRAKGLSIGDTVKTAKVRAAEKGNDELTDALERVRVIDGNENAEIVDKTIVQRIAPDKLIVLATEVGLRALDYKVNFDEITNAQIGQVDLLLFGTELFSTESNLQAFARVNRGDALGARIIVAVDRTVLENRVEVAKKVDEHLRNKFRRVDGLFAARSLAGLDTKKMTLIDLIETAGDFASLEGRGQSALFFMNEQIKSKLIQEPLQDMIAKSKTPAEKAFLEEKLVELLKHYDEFDLGKQGVEYRDPIDIASDAFKSGTGIALKVLTEIAGNAVVTDGLKLQAATRIEDILSARREFEGKIRRPSEKGTFGDLAQYEDAAFTNVSGSARGKPAHMVADVIITLTDYLLPNTQLSREPAGARGAPQRAESYVTSHPARGPTTGDHFVDSLNLDAKPDPMNPTSDGRLLTYEEQKLISAARTFHDMDYTERSTVAKNLAAIGFIRTAVAAMADPKEMAVALGQAWNQAGGRDDQFDMKALLAAAADLSALSNGADITVADVMRVVLSPEADRREAVAEVLSVHSPTASTVARQTAQTREDGARTQTASGLSWLWNSAVAGVHTATRLMRDPAKTRLSAAGTTADALTAVIMLASSINYDQREKVKQVSDTLAGLAATTPALLSKISVKDVVAALKTVSKDISLMQAMQTLVKKADASPTKKWIGRVGTAASFAAPFLLSMVSLPVFFTVLGAAFLLKVVAYDSSTKPVAAVSFRDKVKSAWALVKKQFKDRPVVSTAIGLPGLYGIGFIVNKLSGFLTSTTASLIVTNVLSAPLGRMLEPLINKLFKIAPSTAATAVHALQAVQPKGKDKTLVFGDLVKQIGDEEEVLNAALLLNGMPPDRVKDVMASYGQDEFKLLLERDMDELKDTNHSLAFYREIGKFEAWLDEHSATVITPIAIDKHSWGANANADEAMDFYAGFSMSPQQRSEIRSTSRNIQDFRDQLAEHRSLTSRKAEPKTDAVAAPTERRNAIRDIAFASFTGPAQLYRAAAAEELGENSQEFVAFSMLNFDASLTAQNQASGILFTGLTPEGHAVILQGAENNESGMVLSVKARDGQTSVGSITIQFKQDKNGQTIVSQVSAEGLNDFAPAVIVPNEESADLHVLSDPVAYVVGKEKDHTHVTFARADHTQAGPILTLPNKDGVVTPLEIPILSQPETPQPVVEDEAVEQMIKTLAPTVPQSVPVVAEQKFTVASVENLPAAMKDRVNKFFATHRTAAETGTFVQLAAYLVQGNPVIIWGKVGKEGKWQPIASKTIPLNSVPRSPYRVDRNLGDVESIQWIPAAAQSTRVSPREGMRLPEALVAMGALSTIGLGVLALVKGPAAVVAIFSAASPLFALTALGALGFVVMNKISEPRKAAPVINISQADLDKQFGQGYSVLGNTYWASNSAKSNGNEQIVLRQEQEYSVNGNTVFVVGAGVELRSNVFATESIDVITEPMKEMFSVLPITDMDPAVGPDRGAIRNVEQVLRDPVYGPIAEMISVEPFHLEQKLNVPLAEAPETLGEVFTGNYAPEFKSFVYQQVAYNNQTLATPDSVAVQVDVIEEYADAVPKLVIEQKNPGHGPARPSDYDNGAFSLFTDLTGRDVNFVQTSAEPNTFTLYVPGHVQVINRDSVRASLSVTPQPQRTFVPYFQSLVVAGFNHLLDRIQRPLDPNRLSAAQSAIAAAHDIHFKHNLSPDQIKAVWRIVDQHVSGRSDATIEELIHGSIISGLGIDNLVQQLASQSKILWGAQAGLSVPVQPNLTPSMELLTTRRFAEIAAMPKQSVLPWLAERMLSDINNIELMTAAEARKKRTNNVSMAKVRASLLSYAELGRDQAYSTAVAEQVIGDQDQDYDRQVGVLTSIARGFASTSKGYIDAAPYRITIKNETEFRKDFGAGSAAITGREIVVMKNNFVRMAIALLHELGHPYVERFIKNYSGKGAVVSKARVEAITHDLIAELVDAAQHVDLSQALKNENYDRMIEQDEEGRTFYIPFDARLVKNKNLLDKLKAMPVETNGLIKPIIVAATDSEMETAKAQLGRGIEVVTRDDVRSFAKAGNVAIKRHSEGTYGIPNAVFLATQDRVDQFMDLITLNGVIPEGLFDALASYEDLTTRFNEQKARLAASQA